MSGAIDESAANEECVGPSSEQAGQAKGCEGCPNQSLCASGAGRREDPELALIEQRLSLVKRKVLILSGKGGVGKSTLSAQLGFALAARGLKVGLLDVDICGPSIPQMFGLRGQAVHRAASGWSPVYVQQVAADPQTGGEGEDVELGVMSVGFMTPSDDDALIWRGPRKNGLIKQFLADVDWGELDFLLVDTPPGTSDEHISLVQLLGKTLGPDDGAVIVSTPQVFRHALIPGWGFVLACSPFPHLSLARRWPCWMCARSSPSASRRSCVCSASWRTWPDSPCP